MNMKQNTIKYSVQLDSKIRNISALPSGLGCKFLLCIKGEGDDLIAKAWKRTKPSLVEGEILVRF